MWQPFGTRTGRKTEAATLQPLVDSGMQEFKHDLTTMGDECDCLTVSTFFGTTLLGNCCEDSPFPVLWLASLIAQLVKNRLSMLETPVQFLCQGDPLEKGYVPTSVFLGFPCGSAGKESSCNVEDLGSISGVGRSPGEGKGYHFSIMAWRISCTV